MNISETEAPVRLVAKTCGCRDKRTNKVTYSIVDSYHAEIAPSDTLLKDVLHEEDKRP
jgi:hypothetical protein